MIGAVILAAGCSRRMGRPKMLLPFGDRTLIDTVLDGVLASRAGEAVVVLGAHGDEVGRVVERRGVRTVVNPRPEEGMLSSVVCGLRALGAGVEAVLVVPGDHPDPPAFLIDRLIEAREGTGKGIVVPVHEGRRGHPVLIDARYRGAVEALDPAVGLRQLLRDHPDDVLEVPSGTPAVLADVDQPADYRKALGLRGGRGRA